MATRSNLNLKRKPTVSGFASSGSLLLKNSNDEEEKMPALGSGKKANGTVSETAETNIGIPTGALEIPDEEEILTKLSNNNVETVSRDRSPSLSGGSALPQSIQKDMGRFFGRDLSSVKIHNDCEAHRYTRSIGALAATKSNHIYFSEKVSPESNKRLLAHELTHVVQQSADKNISSTPQLKTDTHKSIVEISDSPVAWQLYQSTICSGKANEHESTQPLDFPETYISSINVSLTNQRVTLGWTGPSSDEAEEIVRRVTGDGIINCTTGAGVRGETSCNDVQHSNVGGSCCTPIGSFTLGAQQCVTSRLHLENFSQFGRPGVGFHFYDPVPAHPASHGCVRLHRGASKIIYDSARSGSTTVNVSGSFPRSYNRFSSCT